MDHFLDKLTGKHDTPKTELPPQPPPASTVAHASTAAPAPGRVQDDHVVAHESNTQTVPSAHDEGSFSFSKLKDALIGGGSEKGHPPDLPPPIAVTQNDHGNAPAATTPGRDRDDWHEKFRDLLDHGASNKREAEEERLRLEKEAVEKEVAAREAEEKASVKGKLKGLFKSDEEEAAEHNRLVEQALAKRREAEEARRKENSLREKIKDVFDNDSEEKERERLRLEEEAKRNQSFGARVRNIFKDAPPPPPPRHSFINKINEMAGGGTKGEAQEGKLDKAIDLYQEHVLHQGPQKNESAWEQAKDDKIADSIRHGFKSVTGHEIRDDDKDRKHGH